MKINWQTKKISEVCEVIAGQSPKGEYYNKAGNGLPFYQGKKEFGEKLIGNPTTWTTDITKEALQGDVLMSVRAPVGPVNFAKERICIGRGLSAIRATALIDKEFLFYFFLKHEKEIIGNTGAVFNSITKTQIGNILVPFPPLTEQKRIVKILDEVYRKIAKAKENAEKNLQNAQELFESYLQSVFDNTGDGWEEKSLEELGNITSSKRIFKSEYVNEGIPFYRTKEIKELANGKSISLELFISRKRYNEIKTKYGIPKEGDVLLSAVGTIGEIYVVQRNDEFYFKDGNIIWLKNFNLVNTYYLKYALKSFVEQIKTLSRGAAYRALTIEKFSKYKVPIMSIKEQQAIVAKLDAISAETRKLEVIYQQKLNDLEELKKSILQKAFNGELGGVCS